MWRSLRIYWAALTRRWQPAPSWSMSCLFADHLAASPQCQPAQIRVLEQPDRSKKLVCTSCGQDIERQ
jgi:hypothetical protein